MLSIYVERSCHDTQFIRSATMMIGSNRATLALDMEPSATPSVLTYYNNTTFTAPDDTMYTYHYGLNNELLDVQLPGTGAITFTDFAWTRPGTVTFPGGMQRSFTYDALMRLKALSVTAPGGDPLIHYDYSYHSAGNLLTKQTEHGKYTYNYDVSSRLKSADNPVLPDETYTYDDVGNRRTSLETVSLWEYNTTLRL